MIGALVSGLIFKNALGIGAMAAIFLPILLNTCSQNRDLKKANKAVKARLEKCRKSAAFAHKQTLHQVRAGQRIEQLRRSDASFDLILEAERDFWKVK